MQNPKTFDIGNDLNELALLLQEMPPSASMQVMPGLLGFCFDTVVGKRSDPEIGGRLGVSLFPGYTAFNAHIQSLLPMHSSIDSAPGWNPIL